MSPSSLTSASGMPVSVMPVLTTVVPESDIPEALRFALDALDNEKVAFMALSDEMLEFLRPEMERLTTELVRKSLDEAWRMRSGMGE